MNPNSPSQFLYLRAIQDHSGDNAVDLELPKGFAGYIYHVGNASELNPIIRNGFISGGKSLKRGRQAVFLSTVNPMEDGNSMGETPRDLTKPRIAPYKNTCKRHQNTVCWCNLKLAQEKCLHFLPKRSRAVMLCNTQFAACTEKAVCMKTQEELYQKGRLTPRLPRVVFKSNSQCGQQDLRSQDARSTWDPSSDSKSYGETCSNTVDHRRPGVLFLRSRTAGCNT